MILIFIQLWMHGERKIFQNIELPVSKWENDEYDCNFYRIMDAPRIQRDLEGDST
jgi:hypothetical protein